MWMLKSPARNSWIARCPGASNPVKGFVAYRVADSSDTSVSSYHIDFGTTSVASGGIATYSGADTVSPVLDHTLVTAQASTSVTVPAVNAATSGEVVGVVSAGSNGNFAGALQPASRRWKVSADPAAATT